MGRSFDYLTLKIEEAGIIVTYNGIVGNNTHRVIDVNECRGFVLVNKKHHFYLLILQMQKLHKCLQ